VKHLDWSADGSCIQSSDQAYELLYFDTTSGKQVKGSCRDTSWTTYSCCLGFPVMGIWPPDSDGTDINALDRSPTSELVLTADDKGKVKLFNWPCVVEDAPSYCYGGHSSHVTSVRWSSDQSYAVSTGGHDRAVFQWKLVPALSKEQQRQQHLRQQQQVLRPVDPEGVLYTAPARHR
jgi:microtubule-associated protein-like 6